MSHSNHITRPDGAKIFYSVHGSGPSLILSNSLATNSEMWELVLPELSKQCQVITYDTRGHGQSSCQESNASLVDLGDDLLAVLDAAGVQQAVLAGVSLGGMTGISLALRKPERLAGLMACNCRARINAEGIAGWDQRVSALRAQGVEGLVGSTLERWFAEDYRKNSPAMMQRMSDIIKTTAASGYVSCVNAIKGLNLHHELQKIKLPVFFLAGAQDGGAPASEMQLMANEVAGSQFKALDPCGHISPMQCPSEFVSLASQFIHSVNKAAK
jgi:3-oxoadipate enol-lactonase